MMQISVIIVFKGQSTYLPYVIKQAAKQNSVHVITDTFPVSEDEILQPNVHWENIEKYWYASDPFKAVYLHMSRNPYDYELLCFTRWFILLEYMKENSLETIFAMDGDVMLFCDVNEAYEPYRQYEATLLHSTAAISSYITYEGLKLFCQFLMDVYSGKEPLIYQELVDKWNRHQNFNQAGGVVDMTLLRIWQYLRTPARIGEMMTVVNGTTFDHNINADDGYAYTDHKLYSFPDPFGKPFIYHEHLKELVTFNSLHCQGGMGKKLIPEIYKLANG